MKHRAVCITLLPSFTLWIPTAPVAKYMPVWWRLKSTVFNCIERTRRTSLHIVSLRRDFFDPSSSQIRYSRWGCHSVLDAMLYVAETPTNGFSARQPEMRHLQHHLQSSSHEISWTISRKDRKAWTQLYKSPMPCVPSAPMPKWS